jgi:hypothetical protein
MLPSNVKSEDFKYRRLPGKDIIDFLKVFEKFLDDFAQKKGIVRESFSFNMALIVEIAIRLDQRRDYYHYFHSSPQMLQSKDFALLSYWTIRYKPFVQARNLAQIFYQENKCSINELIALSIIERDIFSLPNIDCDKVEQAFDKMRASLLHTFMHTDVTKESMLQLVLSLETAFRISE